MSADYLQLLRALLPEVALVVGGLAVLSLDLTAWRRWSTRGRANAAAATGAVACVVAIALVGWVGRPGEVFHGVLMVDGLATVSRALVLLLSLLALATVNAAPALRNPAEQVALMLLGSVGLLLMTSAQQLLLVFVAVELTSLALYVLVGMDKTRPESAEAGLKYFLVGGISGAFLLFGFSLLYGLTGEIALSAIAPALYGAGLSPLAAVAVTMVVVALGFKAAAAPFHLWAPDAYQGAPAPAAALVSSGSKLAALVLFYRLLWPGLYPWAGSMAGMGWIEAGWQAVVLVLAVASILLGNLVALAQSDLRRLMGYSAVAHAGVLLLGLIVAGSFGPALLVYYAAAYGIATAGVFGVIAALQSAGECRVLEDLAGLHRRSPLLAGCLMVFVLSLAGIPPLAGFLAKFQVFAAAIKYAGLGGPVGWVAGLGILMSAVGFYYYLIVLKKAMVTPAPAGASRIRVPYPAAAALVVAAIATLALGIAPSLLTGLF